VCTRPYYSVVKYFTNLDDNCYGYYVTERHPEVIPFLNVRYPTALNTCCILRNSEDSWGSQISERQKEHIYKIISDVASVRPCRSDYNKVILVCLYRYTESLGSVTALLFSC